MIRKHIFKTLVILTILMFTAVYAYTHSGRTDSNGGHHDRKNGGYHYHSGPKTKSSTPTRTTPNLSTNSLSRANDLYIPTKLEWLTLQLNAKYNFGHSGGDSSYVGMFLENKGTGSIKIQVSYKPDMSVADRNEVVETMKKAVQLETTRLGWQSWAKTTVEMERLTQ